MPSGLAFCTYEDDFELCMGADFAQWEIRDARPDTTHFGVSWEGSENRVYILIGYGYPDYEKRYENTYWFCRTCAQEVLFYGQFNQLRTNRIVDKMETT